MKHSNRPHETNDSKPTNTTMMRSPSLASAVTRRSSCRHPRRHLLRCATTAYAALGAGAGDAAAAFAFVAPSAPAPQRQTQTQRALHHQRPSSSSFVPRPLSPSAMSVVPHTPTLLRLRPEPIFSTGASSPSFLPSSSRLYSSRRNNNDDTDLSDDLRTLKDAAGNIVKKAGSKLKNLLPDKVSNMFRSEEEKKAEIVKKQRKEEITGGLSEMLRDFPLPVRMMGRMMSPLVSNLADTFAEQANQVQDVLDDARSALVSDEAVSRAVGEPLTVGQPFSQSSSTSSINGQTTSEVRASFEVRGPAGAGIATVVSSNGSIRSLSVNVNGRTLNVDPSRRGGVGGRGGGGGWGRSRINEEDVIEAEIIDKK